jgi:preprotein translocase subunit SecF
MTYSDMVNLSMNQTLARSINTSLVAILPVLSILVVGAYILGATTLQNYGLALFVGLMSGAYSSIFIASPLLAGLKEREPRFTDLALRVAQKGESHIFSAREAAMLSSEGSQRIAGASARRPDGSVIAPRPRKQKRR